MDDARSLEADLLAHAAWMRRLARRLCADDATADDVLQDARVGALEDAARGRRPRAPRRWLAEVLRNAARKVARAEGRRDGREALAARPEAVPSSADCVSDAEIARALVSAVLELEEPYRSTVVMRFYRGLEPARIAELQGVPSATVRSRLRRGLELVRRDLDARTGGREAWTFAIVPLMALPSARTATKGAAGAAVTGGILMSWKVKLALGGLVAAGAAALAVRRGAAVEPEEALARASAASKELHAQEIAGASETPALVSAPDAIARDARTTAAVPDGHLLLVLEPSQLTQVEGPLAPGDPRVTMTWNGLPMRIADPTLSGQAMPIESRDARLGGLAPGRYHLRAFPDDVALEPAVIEVPSEEPVEVRVRPR